MDINTLGSYLSATGTSSTSSSSSSTSTSGTSLDMEDFLTLLAAELKYQDMSNPMDSSEMMAQMTQMATVTAVNTMSDQMSNLESMSTISYAASMVGKDVTVAASQDSTSGAITTDTGTVSGVGFYNGDPIIYVNGNAYYLSQIMVMGSTTDSSSTSTDTSSSTSA